MANALQETLAGIPGALERISLSPVTELDGSVIEPGEALCLSFRPEAPIQVLFSGHMDTVFGPEHSFQKFSLMENGHAHGPGVCDMKGGLFIMLKSVAAYLIKDQKGVVGGKILITGDEEIGSPASHDLLLESAKSCHLGLVFESALPGGELVCERKGTGTFRVTAHGKSAHTGRDFASGRNAVAAIAALMVDCHLLNDSIPDAIINVGSIHGGGPVNVVPDWAEAWLNVRVGQQQTIPQFEGALNKLLEKTMQHWEGIRLECSGSISRPPKEESAQDAALHTIWNKAEVGLGLNPSGKRATGGSSDGNLFSSVGLPNLDGIGIRGGAIHSADEFAILESIPEQIDKTMAFLDLLSADPEILRKPPFSLTR